MNVRRRKNYDLPWFIIRNQTSDVRIPSIMVERRRAWCNVGWRNMIVWGSILHGDSYSRLLQSETFCSPLFTSPIHNSYLVETFAGGLGPNQKNNMVDDFPWCGITLVLQSYSSSGRYQIVFPLHWLARSWEYCPIFFLDAFVMDLTPYFQKYKESTLLTLELLLTMPPMGSLLSSVGVSFARSTPENIWLMGFFAVSLLVQLI